MFHEWRAATRNMAVLPGASGVPSATFRTSSPCDVPFRYASDPIPRYRGTVARWHPHLHDLATAIHETSGLDVYAKPKIEDSQKTESFF
jgi:hypothetical protein